MNNLYRQFTVQPRLNVRFQANTPSNNLSNSNFSNSSVATVRMLSPTVARPNQRMYNTVYSTPVMAVDGSQDLNAVGQAAYTPMYMMNSHPCVPVMPVMPIIPVELGNQHSRDNYPTNFPDAADLLGQRVTENAPVLQHHIPALQSQALSARQTHNAHTFPRVLVTQRRVQNTANIVPGFVRTPFRQVRWIPPAVRQTGVPHTPFAVEIKPDDDETPQNPVPFGNISANGSVVPANNAGCETECGSSQSVPTVYLDIVTDSSSYCHNTNTQMADVPSVVGEVTVVNVNKTHGKRKCSQRGKRASHSGIKILKLPVRNEYIIQPAVSSASSIPVTSVDNTTVADHRLESVTNVEEIYVTDDEELNDNCPIPVQETEHSNDKTAALSPSTISVVSEPGVLIRSDEDVGDGDMSDDGDTCLPNEGVNLEKSECYEVVSKNSDALLFDMECDEHKDGETLRVILPTRSSKAADAQTATNSKTADAQMASSVRKTAKSKRSLLKKRRPLLKKHPAKSHSSIVRINLDDDDTDVVVVEPKQRTTNVPVTRSQRLAAREQNHLQSVTIKVSENSLLGIPIQSSFFRFETQSSEVLRLLSMAKSLVPSNVLTLLTDLVSSASAATDKNHSSGSDFTNSTFSSIPQAENRKILFQCLFCPYGELSAKRVMAHVRQHHRNCTSFIQRSLLPTYQTMLHIYCRHCNFITYDSAALLVHFAVYHNVAGILLSSPKVIENDPTWEPVINPEAKARNFPFFCCPDCGYIDVERNRLAQHVLQKKSSKSVFFGCVVRLIMVVRGSKPLGAYTHKSLANENNHAVFRKEIYACVSCRFYSFYPSYAFSHYVISHGCLKMLYVCAASPSCTKRCTSHWDMMSHIEKGHVAMKRLGFQCTATLLDRSTLTQLDISPGELTFADVPVQMQYQSPLSASNGTSLEAAIEIVDDDSTDSDSDVVVLGSPHDRDTSVDVEPDSPSSAERSRRTEVPKNTEPFSSEQAASEQKRSESCIISSECCATETVAEHHEQEENIDSDTMHSVENGTSSVKANGATCDMVASLGHSQDQTELGNSDVVVLGSPRDRDTSVDVEPDSPSSAEHSRCTEVPKNTEPFSSEQAASEQKQSESCIISPQTVAKHQEQEENIDSDTMRSVENGNSKVKDNGVTCDMVASLGHSEDQTELGYGQNSTAGLNSRFEDESLKSEERDLQSGKTEEQLDRTESQSVESTVTMMLMGTGHAELVKCPFDSSSSSKVTDPVADSTVVNDTSVPSNDESSTKLESVRNSVPVLTSHKESVDHVECSTSLSKNTDTLVDVSSSVSHADKSCTESESVANQFPGTSFVESADCTEAPAFLDDNMHELPEHATAVNDSVSDAASIHVSLEVHHQSHDLPDGEHSTSVNKSDVRSPLSNTASTVEQEMFIFDAPDNVDFFDCLVDDDSLPNFELCKSPSDRLESTEHCSLERELLMLPKQLTDELQHCSKVEHAVATCSAVSDADSVVDDSCIVSSKNPCLGSFQESSDDTFCSNTVENEQLPAWSQETDVVDNSLQENFSESSVPSCISEMPSESNVLQVSAQVDSANRQRFKSLASFRFPVPHLFKPS